MPLDFASKTALAEWGGEVGATRGKRKRGTYSKDEEDDYTIVEKRKRGMGVEDE